MILSLGQSVELNRPLQRNPSSGARPFSGRSGVEVWMASHHQHFGGGFGDERARVSDGEFVVEDLNNGLNEWRNIQDIVRLSFVAFHKALQAQGDAIAALTEQTELRALKSDVRAAFETHEELLNVRVGEGKTNGTTSTDGESSDDAAKVRLDDLERRLTTAEVRLEKFATRADLQRASDETRAALDTMLRNLRGEMGSGGAVRGAGGMNEHGHQTRTFDDTPRAPRLDATPASAAQSFNSFFAPPDVPVSHTPSVTDTHNATPFVTTHQSAPQNHGSADLARVHKVLNQKADAASVRALAERMEQIAGSYATKRELSVVNESIVSAADLQNMSSEKVGVDEVNRALAEVSAALDEKASVSTLETFAKETQVALRGVVHETALSVGRWIWKSGRTKSNGAVPWNVQSVNTDPGNFRWEKDKTTLHTAAPGLYEVTFGFFTRKKPAIRLLINGEPVLAAVNSASYVLHHSSGRLTSATRHPDGNVTGLTLIDFLALPAKAKIAVTYEGETNAQGFISLRKL